jgi:AraC-like DNA-binding protein
MIPFFLLSGNAKMEFVENLADEGSLFMTIVLLSYMVSGIVYIALSLVILRRHRKFLVLNYSNTDMINLNWLRYLIIGMIVIYSLVTIGHLIDGVVSINIGDFVDNLIFLAVSGFVIMIGYFGIKQTTIFAGEMSTNAVAKKKDIGKDNPGTTRYQKSGLKAEQADDLQIRLEMMMREEKPFLNEKLTLKFLADKLDIHPNYLSQVINERFQRNFYDFINTARIEEFKALIQEPRSKNLTLLAVAFDCGFSSKSSFNKFFKKSTGQTPSDFVRAQNI